MIVEEAGEYLKVMHANGLAPVFLAAPTSPDERLKAIAENSQGFVYAISRVGITGTQTELASRCEGAGGAAAEVYEAADCAGVWGVDAGACAAVGEFADAAVVGSAIVGLIEKTPAAEAPKAVGEFVRLAEACGSELVGRPCSIGRL